MNIQKFLQAMSVVVILTSVISGCRRDPVLEELKYLKKKAKAEGYGAVEQRYELALSMWQNRTVDCEPILITAQLGKLPGNEDMYLRLITFDEDKDIVGIVINEEYTDVNGVKITLNEEYPAFVYRVIRGMLLGPRLLPVQIRDAGQRKDKQRWDKYERGEGIDVNDVWRLKLWRKTLPPVWVSIPEPNAVKVHVYIYDQAGHKSEPIKLLTSDPITEE